MEVTKKCIGSNWTQTLWMKRSHMHWPDTLTIPKFLNNVLEMFLRDFLGSILECQNHTVILKSMIQTSHSTTSQRCFIKMTSGVCRIYFSSVIVMLKKPLWNDWSFVAWHIILQEAAIRRQVQCGMDKVSNTIQVGYSKYAVAFKKAQLGNWC